MSVDTRDVQVRLIAMISTFHDVCVQNGLVYYIIGGTMLGAVRHKGFIPWDDDIDIGMPRKDYDILIEKAKDLFDRDYLIKSYASDPSFEYQFAKLFDSNTTLIEYLSYKKEGVVGGIYVDIFPIDGLGNTRSEAASRFNKCVIISKLIRYKIMNCVSPKYLGRILQVLLRPIDLISLRRMFDWYLNKHEYCKCDYVANILGAWGLKEIMPRSHFGNPTEYLFEGLKLLGPEKADEYLSSLYGDYMTLPPLGKRQSHHKSIYVNLDLPFAKYEKEEVAK
jgi:lipopolysaccharide cholinephosphotransferase